MASTGRGRRFRVIEKPDHRWKGNDVQIRFLEYFIALEKERHFARAAALCNVSQPTLSTGLVALEEQLGKRLVERDRRFTGLTKDGEAILPWAQQAVAAYHNLVAVTSKVEGAITGEARIGAVPAAMPVVGHLARRIALAHPRLRLSFQSRTSSAIVRGLAASELDAGLTYREDGSADPAHFVPLYRENFLFLTGMDHPLFDADVMTLEKALRARLCLLPAEMQNRRILDEEFRSRGLNACPTVTADSFEALISLVATGGYATFLPESYRLLIPGSVRATKTAPLLPASQIGLLIADRGPVSPIAEAVCRAAESLNLPADFTALIDDDYQRSGIAI